MYFVSIFGENGLFYDAALHKSLEYKYKAVTFKHVAETVE